MTITFFPSPLAEDRSGPEGEAALAERSFTKILVNFDKKRHCYFQAAD